MRVVFDSRNRRACRDRALVLESLRIPYEIIDDQFSCALVVPAEFSARAAEELRKYDEENPPRTEPRRVRVETYDPVPGLFGYVIVLTGIGLFAGAGIFSENWRATGRVSGELIRQGEWWRNVTALTLHSDLQHLVGNLLFGLLFGFFAGRLLGSGVAWLGIVVAAAVGNALNTFLLSAEHASVGASTAVFAALGMVAGHVWRAKLMRQDHWPYRVGPIVGGLALLMYTGTGGPDTDVGAHLMGFVCGFVLGILLVRYRERFRSDRLQLGSALTTLTLIGLAWIRALID